MLFQVVHLNGVHEWRHAGNRMRRQPTITPTRKCSHGSSCNDRTDRWLPGHFGPGTWGYTKHGSQAQALASPIGDSGKSMGYTSAPAVVTRTVDNVAASPTAAITGVTLTSSAAPIGCPLTDNNNIQTIKQSRLISGEVYQCQYKVIKRIT